MGTQYPEGRSRLTRDRSRMRESRTSGSARWARSNPRPYRDHGARIQIDPGQWSRQVDAFELKLHKLTEPVVSTKANCKSSETRTCKTLPDGQPSSPEQHQASD